MFCSGVLKVFWGQLYFCELIFKVTTSRLKSLKFASSKFIIMHTFCHQSQGVRTGGENLTPTIDNLDDDLTLPTISTCPCGKSFGNARGLRTHQSRWCANRQQRNLPTEGNKSIDGNQSPDLNHSAQEPIACSLQPPSASTSNAKIQWSKGNAKAEWASLDSDLSIILRSRLRGSTVNQLSLFSSVVYETSLEKFGAVESKNGRP